MLHDHADTDGQLDADDLGRLHGGLHNVIPDQSFVLECQFMMQISLSLSPPKNIIRGLAFLTCSWMANTNSVLTGGAMPAAMAAGEGSVVSLVTQEELTRFLK